MDEPRTLISEVEERAEFMARNRHQRVDFIENLKTFPVVPRRMRGNAGAYFELGDNRVLDAHISEIRPGGHGKKHRHNNEAVVYILFGRGYSIIQKEGEAPRRYDWQEGSLLNIPQMAWHQHFNLDPERPARYLAVTCVPLLAHLGVQVIEQPAGEARGGDG
ncbi:MAG TPA: cupin domain-containing protein [Thermodesulfobacteriota bacterium]|nr:cupin domain-containing protein [Thermodesulfobacteriota bacterium]